MCPRPLLVLFLVAPLLWAQPQLTADNLRNGKATASFLEGNPADIAPGNSGLDVTWDFSGLQPLQASTIGYARVALADAPDSDAFPTANAVDRRAFPDGDRHQYWQITDDRLISLGQRGGDLDLTYEDPLDLLALPADFNDMVADDFRGEYSAEGTLVNREGSSTTTVDGTGTLMLPDGMLADVLRLHTQQVITDTALGPDSNVVNLQVDHYRFYAPGQTYPSLEIQFIQREANGVQVFLSSVFYEQLQTSNLSLESRWLPHITSETGGFDTQLYVTNGSTQQDTLTLRGYGENGALLSEVALNVAGGAYERFLIADLFAESRPSHLGIMGCHDCSLGLGYRADLPSAAVAHVGETVAVATPVHLYTGDPALVFDGIAVVNLGDGPASIEAQRLDKNGQVTASASLAADLPVRGKTLAVLANLFIIEADDLVRIQADQPLAIIGLRGTRGNNEPFFLYENRPLTFPQNP